MKLKDVVHLPNVVNLSLNGSVEEIFNQNLIPNVIKLNLSNNNFKSLKIFGYLPEIKELVLNCNKISKFYKPGDKNSGKSSFSNISVFF